MDSEWATNKYNVHYLLPHGTPRALNVNILNPIWSQKYNIPGTVIYPRKILDVQDEKLSSYIPKLNIQYKCVHTVYL